MNRAHDMEIRNLKVIAKQYAIEFFKTKADDLNKIFTMETLKVLSKYEGIRFKL